MKGGVAAAMFALRALAGGRRAPAGDVIFEAVPDEETCAMGTVAAIERGYRADAGLVPEPTRLNLWIATRGLLHGSFASPAAPPTPRSTSRLAGGRRRQRDRARAAAARRAAASSAASGAAREDKRHPLLGTPRVQPTIVRGGAFISNVPEALAIHLNATYLPATRTPPATAASRAAEIVDAVEASAAPTTGWPPAPGALDLGDGLPAVGDRRPARPIVARRRARRRARARPRRRGSRASTRPTTARC